MSRNLLLYLLAALVCVIAGLHIAAIAFHLYWTVWWYDMILHLLGGVFAALLVLWIRFLSGYVKVPPVSSVSQAFWPVLLLVIIVGAGWEVFERLLGQTWSIEGYWLDTGIDVTLDVAGGLIGFLFFKRNFPLK